MNTKIKKQLFVVAAIVFQTALWAQPGMNNDGGDLEGNDAPPASINDSMFWLVLIGLFLAYFVVSNSRSRLKN
jgi:hypothetical protein